MPWPRMWRGGGGAWISSWWFGFWLWWMAAARCVDVAVVVSCRGSDDDRCDVVADLDREAGGPTTYI